ncbi:cathelicidin antimicrobial peptide [Rhinolophus ferrumequinum]|nr:cathelicidin antimicrobial peptide [Rhinolophus ferrumequinum]KAF6312596.1 cathelicidin antimicrobial peptide [Rhinolophus ferrumequinum]
METQGGSPSLRRWSLLLLLLGLAMPPATAQALTYREAVLRAVDGFNQQSSEASLYRLLELDQQPHGDGNPNIPQPVSFTVKETVCPRSTQQPTEQCDFKEKGLVKQCVGTVTLDQVDGYFDISCEELRNVKLGGRLREIIRKGGRKIGQGLENIGKRIKDFFSNVQPREES